MTKRLANQMDFTFSVGSDEAVGFFEGNLTFGEGDYGVEFEEDGHGYDYYYLADDGRGNAYWSWCGDRLGQDGPLLNQYLAKRTMGAK